MTALAISEPRARLALGILALALPAGVLGDALLRALPWGLSLPVCTVALVAGGAALVRAERVRVGPDAPWLALTAVLAAAAFVRRDSSTLQALDLVALLCALSATALATRGVSVRDLGISAYLLTTLAGIAHALFGALLLLGDVPWNALTPRSSQWSRIRAVFLGLLLAAPLLLVFGGLFVSADAQFEALARRLLVLDLGPALQHVFFTGVWGALAAGMLRGALLDRSALHTYGERQRPMALPCTSGLTVLALVNALFLLFVVLQLRWLFGGTTVVEQTTGLTLAQYARRGFFELATAAALTLPVLLVGDWVTRRDTPGERRVFRWLATLTVLLVAGLLASALQRMLLYVAEFGLTELRLYTTTFMMWLAGVLAWFVWTVLHEHGGRHRFAFGAMVQAGAVLAGLHLLNPDAAITRVAAARAAHGATFDAAYAGGRLSADAVPALLEALPRLGPAERGEVARRLLARWGDAARHDWRSWNWAESRAHTMVRARAAELAAIPAPSQHSTSRD